VQNSLGCHFAISLNFFHSYLLRRLFYFAYNAIWTEWLTSYLPIPPFNIYIIFETFSVGMVVQDCTFML